MLNSCILVPLPPVLYVYYYIPRIFFVEVNKIKPEDGSSRAEVV